MSFYADHALIGCSGMQRWYNQSLRVAFMGHAFSHCDVKLMLRLAFFLKDLYASSILVCASEDRFLLIDEECQLARISSDVFLTDIKAPNLNSIIQLAQVIIYKPDPDIIALLTGLTSVKVRFLRTS